MCRHVAPPLRDREINVIIQIKGSSATALFFEERLDDKLDLDVGVGVVFPYESPPREVVKAFFSRVVQKTITALSPELEEIYSKFIENFIVSHDVSLVVITFAGIDFSIPLRNSVEKICNSTALHDSLRICVPLGRLEECYVDSEFGELCKVEEAYKNKWLIIPKPDQIFNVFERTVYSLSRGYWVTEAACEISHLFRLIFVEKSKRGEVGLPELQRLIKKKVSSKNEALIVFLNAFFFILNDPSLYPIFDFALVDEDWIELLPSWVAIHFGAKPVYELYSYISLCIQAGVFPDEEFRPLIERSEKAYLEKTVFFSRIGIANERYLVTIQFPVIETFAIHRSHLDRSPLRNEKLVVQFFEHVDLEEFGDSVVRFLWECFSKEIVQKVVLKWLGRKELSSISFVTSLLSQPINEKALKEIKANLLVCLKELKSYFTEDILVCWISFFLSDQPTNPELLFVLFAITQLQHPNRYPFTAHFVKNQLPQLKPLLKTAAQLENYQKCIRRALDCVPKEEIPEGCLAELDLQEIIEFGIDIAVRPEVKKSLMVKLQLLEKPFTLDQFDWLWRYFKKDLEFISILFNQLARFVHEDGFYLKLYPLISDENKLKLIEAYTQQNVSVACLRLWILEGGTYKSRFNPPNEFLFGWAKKYEIQKKKELFSPLVDHLIKNFKPEQNQFVSQLFELLFSDGADPSLEGLEFLSDHVSKLKPSEQEDLLHFFLDNDIRIKLILRVLSKIGSPSSNLQLK